MGSKRHTEIRHKAAANLFARRRAQKRHKSLLFHGHLASHLHKSAASNRESALARVIEDISALICGYPRVTGMYYKVSEKRVGVIVVAQKPMTRPIQELLDGFSRKLCETLPDVEWFLAASPEPPPPIAGYHCTSLTLQ